MIYLALLGMALAAAAVGNGGVDETAWSMSWLAIGVLASVYWWRTPPPRRAPKPAWWLLWPPLLLAAYVALQLVPLPLWALEALSPARARVVQDLAPVAPGLSAAPLSVSPMVTLAHLLRVAGYTLIFFLVRELTWKSSERPWRGALPLIALATAEAGLGMAQQVLTGEMATGTYVNRDHFAGLLELVLPLAALYAVATFLGGTRRREAPAGPALRACLLLACAGLLLAAATFSYSRMGFAASLVALAVAGALASGAVLKRRAHRMASLSAATAAAAAFVFLPPDPLILRFATMAEIGGISKEERFEIWRETRELIREYPVFGCGLGAYESAFEKHQRVAPLYWVSHAHNDYLQLVAELGLAGIALAAALAVAITVQAARALSAERTLEERLLGAAALGALAAIAAHSVVDFNLYIPVNAAAVAWIAAMAAGVVRWRTDEIPEREPAVRRGLVPHKPPAGPTPAPTSYGYPYGHEPAPSKTAAACLSTC